MLFSSISFLFLFLPFSIIGYALCPAKIRNFFLLFLSLIFYAFGEIRYLPVLIAVISINYVGALLINKFEKKSKFYLLMTLFLNIGILVYFKYFNFILENLNKAFHINFPELKIILPLGISFYIFQAISYTIDVYRKQVTPQKSLYKLALYITLFPQLIAGPIVKYHDFFNQINERHITVLNFYTGIRRFIVGLAKKVLIANTLGNVAERVFTQSPFNISPYMVWIGYFCYGFQIYFDFSGYSDMAIGLARLFGFNILENFNYPYISRSMTEFWHRWHISLSSWFKEYVYIPLGGNKRGIFITIRNLCFVFILTGLWHGGSWNFILWGMWNGFFVIIEKLICQKNIGNKCIKNCPRILKHIYCTLVVLIGWSLFYQENLQKTWLNIQNMFLFIPEKKMDILFSPFYYFEIKEMFIFIIAILCSTPLFKNMLNLKNTYMNIGVDLWLLFVYFLSIVSVSSGTYNPFIYFRF